MVEHKPEENGMVSLQSKHPTVDKMTRYTTIPPPELPHVQVNQVSLATIVRNLTVFTIKELSQFLKTNVNQSQENTPSQKKINFLQLIIFLRNQYLKLYVLIKWTKTIKNNNFNTMIDLLNWFRESNMSVNNCIWALKGNLTSMANAKLPNVDLVTALEVLTLGRPNLPNHNYPLSGEINNSNADIPSDLILKRLRDLNLTVSIKISVMDLPPQFKNYRVKDGRIYIVVKDEFEIQLSTIDRDSPLFFVDMKLLFNYNNTATKNDTKDEDTINDSLNATHKELSTTNNSGDNGKIPTESNINLPLNKRKLEKIINDILFKSGDPLLSLYQFLHKYILTLQLYMIHLELINLETNGKFTGGSLIHNYDSKKSIITGRYWLNGKLGNKGKFTIGVDKRTETLILRWDSNPQRTNDKDVVTYTQLLQNMENILDEITFNHANLIRSELLLQGLFHEDEDDPNVLLLQIPTTCVSTAPVQMKMDLITGLFYFKNPTPLLMTYAHRINRTTNNEELSKVLQQLKLDKITDILYNMFEKTGWICSKAITLTEPITNNVIRREDLGITKQTNNRQNEIQSILQKDLFTCLPNWPINWYLIITVISSNSTCIIEKRMGKIISQKGKWKLSYLDQDGVTISKLENITYQKIMSLQNSILHRIINHMLIDSLNQLKIENKVCTKDIMQNQLPSYLTNDIIDSVEVEPNPIKASPNNDVTNNNNTNFNTKLKYEYISLIMLELQSFLEGSTALNDVLEDSIYMRIDYKKSEIRLYAKFKMDTMIKQIPSKGLLICLIDDEPMAFYLTENFDDLRHIIKYLTIFREKLMQLVVIIDVVDRLHKNFASDYFKIIALKPNQISFKYLDNDKDETDCTVNITTTNTKVEVLTIDLAKSNPQSVIQPFINAQKLDYHSTFNYLQFTSSLFTAFQKIMNDETFLKESQLTQVQLSIHGLNEYQIIYINNTLGSKISLLVELKAICQNVGRKFQYYVHFATDEHFSTKSVGYPRMVTVRNNIFMLGQPKQTDNGTTTPAKRPHKKFPRAVRLIDGIACDAGDIEPILLEIHDILKQDGEH